MKKSPPERDAARRRQRFRGIVARACAKADEAVARRLAPRRADAMTDPRDAGPLPRSTDLRPLVPPTRR